MGGGNGRDIDGGDRWTNLGIELFEDESWQVTKVSDHTKRGKRVENTVA